VALRRVLAALTAIPILLSTVGCTGVGSGILSGAGCNNSLFPVIAGATWTYAASGTATGTYVRTITDVRGNGFTEQDVYLTGNTRTNDWKCKGGALIDQSIGGRAMAGNALQVTGQSGVTLPAEVRPGDSWSQMFNIQIAQTRNGKELTGKGDITFDCKAVEFELLTVAAGSFGAIRVECQNSVVIIISSDVVAIPINISSASTLWYSAGTGLIKTVTQSGEEGSSVIELSSYSIP
jgi:hypothetical protein